MQFEIPYIINECIVCRTCFNLEGSCPITALTISEGDSYVINIDYDKCINCGACVNFVRNYNMCSSNVIQIKTVEIWGR